MKRLADGLSLNKTITSLSLTYCNIDFNGARALFEVLIFTKSTLEELNLTGNHLRNEGVSVVLRGLSIAKSLKKIYLTDNQFNDDPEMLEGFKKCMCKNKTLGRYDLMYNNIQEDGVTFFMDVIENNAKHVYELEFSERGLAKDQIKELQEKLKANKPKKGKKKGGKKKKKK
jgi:Ran GTPase-activating protein (RanGAP) involved in mRNA processing and transport